MTVVLVGASGWLGAQLCPLLGEHRVVPARAALDDPDGALAAALDVDAPVVVNVAGARSGDPATMERLNARLPALLGRAVVARGAHLVHTGSAAEYGLSAGGTPLREADRPDPGSDYGRTKLDGTRAALDAGGTVLRVFNVAAAPAQPGSPLEDVAQKVASAARDGADVPLFSPDTVRDWVSAGFVVRSLLAAAQHRPTGVFNVCSGIGVRFGDAVERALRALGGTGGVVDLAVSPPSTVIGSPDRWRSAVGLQEAFGTDDLARTVVAAASRGQEYEEDHSRGSIRP